VADAVDAVLEDGVVTAEEEPTLAEVQKLLWKKQLKLKKQG